MEFMIKELLKVCRWKQKNCKMDTITLQEIHIKEIKITELIFHKRKNNEEIYGWFFDQ